MPVILQPESIERHGSGRCCTALQQFSITFADGWEADARPSDSAETGRRKRYHQHRK
jgi:hypothetical protein